MIGSKRSLTAIAAVLALVQATTADSITTFFAGTSSSVGGVLFELRVTNPGGVLIQGMDLNILGYGAPYFVKVYITPDTYLGKEHDPQAWTAVAQANGVSTVHNNPTYLDLADFWLAPGSYGVAIHDSVTSLFTTVGSGTNQNFANADISLRMGASMTQLFGGNTFSPRVWNGTLYYNGGPPPTTTYCTGWPIVNPPQITFSGTPSATSSSGFTVFGYYVGYPGGPVPGVLMYGFQGAAAIPFHAATLCIQPPVERTSPVLLGAPSIDGFQIDMNAFAAGALGGHPHPALRVPGTSVNCQWWGRRWELPPNHFVLTNALRYTIEP